MRKKAVRRTRVSVGGITPINAKERRRIHEQIRAKHAWLRKRYKEVRGDPTFRVTGCKLSPCTVTERCHRAEEAQTMPSRICCRKKHSTKGLSIHDAAIAISEGRAIGECKTCGEELQYRIDHTYANDPSEKQHSFVVTRAVRLRTRAADETYDPFLLVLREIATSEVQILPTYWAHGRSNTDRGGQFPPMLSLEEWKTLFRQLDASFDELEKGIRLRAYQLYEHRGRRGGHALDDWLESEAELKGLRALRVAA
jgi:hypothetical protein